MVKYAPGAVEQIAGNDARERGEKSCSFRTTRA